MRPAEPCTVTQLEYVISRDGDDFTVAKVPQLARGSLAALAAWVCTARQMCTLASQASGQQQRPGGKSEDHVKYDAPSPQ